MNLLRKRTKLILFAALALLPCAVGASLLCGSAGLSAAALTREDAALFLPGSYEQYLALESPKDVSVNDSHIAIADGNSIYLYTRGTEEYRVYTHGTPSATFGKIQLVGDTLYFTDAAMALHTLDLTVTDRFEVADVGYSLANFVVADGKIYGTTTMGTTTSLYALDADGSTEITSEDPLAPGLPAQLPMTYCDGTFYYAVTNMVFPVDTSTDTVGSFFTLTQEALVSPASICAVDGKMYYSDEAGLHCSDMVGGSELIDGNLRDSALTAFDGKLYCAAGTAVREMETETNTFTGYEITSASDSVNRLSGAVETVRAGDLLVTADAGNRRVTVAKLARGENGNYAADFSAIDCVNATGDSYTPTLVATDGSVIAVASEDCHIYLYHVGDPTYFYRHSTENNPVTGLTCVYGNTYFVTGHNFGKAEEGSPLVQRNNNRTNISLASDLYGDLFVVYGNHTVGRFHESNFLDNRISGEDLAFTLPEGFTSLRADFEGNLYCLLHGKLYKNGASQPLAEIDGSDYVYTMSEDVPLSYALGFEDDEVFFLFGDHIVKTAPGALDIPTLNEISAEGVYERVFAPHGEDDLLVEIPAGTIGIRTDLDALRADDPAYFPYSHYFRTDASLRGILLAEQGGYALVVNYEVYESNRVFTANLFRMDPREDGLLVLKEEYWTENEGTMYISNRVSSYFYPGLPAALADAELARGTCVSVLGTVHAPERDYALIEFRTADGSARRGYVPASYLTDVDPIQSENEDYVLGYLKTEMTFTAEDGETRVLAEGEQVRLYANGDGTYTARITDESGKIYSAQVDANSVRQGESDALRIALIVILSVLALLIIGVYCYLLPKKPKKRS